MPVRQKGRAMLTMSAAPAANAASQSSAVLNLFVVTSGTWTLPINFLVYKLKSAPGHHGHNGRDARFMPQFRVDRGRPCALHVLSQRFHLRPVASTGHKVEHAQPVHHNEILTNRFTHPREDLDGKPATAFEVAAPSVVPVVGLSRNELVDQIPHSDPITSTPS